MMAEDKGLYGMTAMFDSAEGLVEATRQATAAGYRCLDTYTPFPIQELAEIIGFRRDNIGYLVLLGTILGGLAGYLIQYWTAVVDYPINVGGKPLHSWPSFMLVTFELAVLGGALGGFFGMLALNGLPRPHHPIFNSPHFELETRNRFFLCIEARDPTFDREKTRAFLEDLGPLEVAEVEV